MSQPAREPWWRRWSPAWVALLGMALYAPSLGFGFVDYDDLWLIQRNAILQDPSWESWVRVWTDLSVPTRRILGNQFLPLTDSSVMLDVWLFGDRLWGHHLTNVLLYGLLCAGLARILERWSGRRDVAWYAGLLFAVHPVHVEAVAWLSERKGLLAGVFFCGAALSLHRYRAGRGPAWWACAAACMALAVWSKAMAMAGAGLLLAMLWIFPGPREASAARVPPGGERMAGAGLVLLSVAAFVPGWETGRAMTVLAEYHGGDVASTAWMMLEVHGAWVRQVALLHGSYGIHYPVDAETVSRVGVLLGAGSLAVALGVGLRPLWARPLKGDARLASLAAAWWLVWLLPVSQVLVPLRHYMADRYLLLPSLAWARGAARRKCGFFRCPEAGEDRDERQRSGGSRTSGVPPRSSKRT